MVNGIQRQIIGTTPEVVTPPRIGEQEARAITIGIPAVEEITPRQERLEELSQIKSSIESEERGIQNLEVERRTEVRTLRETRPSGGDALSLQRAREFDTTFEGKVRQINERFEGTRQERVSRIKTLTQRRAEVRAQRVPVTEREREIARLLPEAVERRLEEVRGPGKGAPLEIVTGELFLGTGGGRPPEMEIFREESVITPVSAPVMEERLFTERAGEILTGGLAEFGRGLQELVPLETELTTRVISEVTLGLEGELISERPVLVPAEREVSATEQLFKELRMPFQPEIIGGFILPTPPFIETGRISGEELLWETGRILEIPEQILAITPEQVEQQGIELQRLVETREIGTELLGTIERQVTERPLETAVGLGLLIGAPRLIGRARAPRVTRTIDLGRIEATVVGEEITGTRAGISVFQAGRREFLVTDIGTFAGRVTPDVTFTLGRGGFAIQRIRGGARLGRPRLGRVATQEAAERITRQGQELIRSISVSELDIGRRTFLGEAVDVAKETEKLIRAFDGRVETGLTLESVGARAIERGPTVGLGRATVRITEFAPVEDLGVSIVGRPRQLQLRQIIPPAQITFDKAIGDIIRGTEVARIEFGARAAITPEIFGEIFGPRARVVPRIEEQQIISPLAEELGVSLVGRPITIQQPRETLLTDFDELLRQQERISARPLEGELQVPTTLDGLMDLTGELQAPLEIQLQAPRVAQIQEPIITQIQEPRLGAPLITPTTLVPPGLGPPLLLPRRVGAEQLMDLELGGPGFFVEVKRRGKFRKLPGDPQTRRGALGRGAKVVSETPGATFRIFPAGRPTMNGREFEGIFEDLSNQFRAPRKKGKPVRGTNTFIEKRKFWIDTPGEKRGMTEKGIRAPRKKRRSSGRTSRGSDIMELGRLQLF